MPLRGDPTGSGRLLVELLDMTSVITANIQVKETISRGVLRKNLRIFDIFSNKFVSFSTPKM